MLHGLKRFFRDTRGNVIMIIGLALPVVFLAIGGAVDFSRVMQLKKELQDAADVASVGSVAVNSYAYKANTKGHSSFKTGENQALAIFNSNVKKHNDLNNIKVKAKIKKQSTNLVSEIGVTADYRPYLLGLMGMNTMPITIKSTSSSTFPPYIDFYLLLDNSPSMGVGATTKDIDTMVANTSDKCAFACHQMDKAGNDYYALAKKLKVTTRIDVVRQATQNLMTTAKNTQTLTDQYRMAIYHFGMAADQIDSKNPAPYEVSALTTNLSTSASNAAKIDLMTIPYQNYNSDRQTNFPSYLLGMNKVIPSSGDGSSSSKPQQVLFFVSDGANDGYDCAYSNGASCRRISPLDTPQCKAMKARGVKIAVLYTTYLPLPTNAFYNSHLAKYVSPTSQLAAKMQECATEGLYFEVGPNEGISEAMNALFAKVISTVRISS
ncbi:von Willebrand factor type A [Asticcacaulis biprosthecium C19]|uniref:von Willebrand factor type A n=1 Tax=Asticcacaulis biprosthecium C19 TaxID=715226 RepID=F4QIW1_9CAUL|nr:VWA domain-containing protein [Asticcacaulis biprosthecium]EGF93024.1 von Willebrand factor type A [Asticcacaulis biprosthecium C19]